MPLEYVDFNAFTRIVIWSVYVGIVISSVYIFLYKSITSRFVKRLCDEKAFEIQSSKSFKELQIREKSSLPVLL